MQIQVIGSSTPTPERTLTRCLVCGSSEVRTDEVVDRGVVFLAECAHCDHRWTAPLPEPSREVRLVRGPAPVVRRAGGEVSTAA